MWLKLAATMGLALETTMNGTARYYHNSSSSDRPLKAVSVQQAKLQPTGNFTAEPRGRAQHCPAGRFRAGNMTNCRVWLSCAEVAQLSQTGEEIGLNGVKTMWRFVALLLMTGSLVITSETPGTASILWFRRRACQKQRSSSMKALRRSRRYKVHGCSS